MMSIDEQDRALESGCLPGRLSDWRGLDPDRLWLWFQRAWADVVSLRERYRLPVRSRWWEDAVQVEALSAVAAWVARYDEGEWEDPPGKLGLLFELERVCTLLRDGREPFVPDRDHVEFTKYVLRLGAIPPEPAPPPGGRRGVATRTAVRESGDGGRRIR